MGYHFASSAFTKPNWDEFEKAVAGGWRTQGFHGPAHVFTVKKTDVKHPISEGLPAEFEHTIDELYQNSMLVPGSVVLATAYSDPKKPKGTGKDEPVDLGQQLRQRAGLRKRAGSRLLRRWPTPSIRIGCAGASSGPRRESKTEQNARRSSRSARLQFGAVVAACTERFVERFAADPELGAEELRGALARTRGSGEIRKTGPSPCWRSIASGPWWRSSSRQAA